MKEVKRLRSSLATLREGTLTQLSSRPVAIAEEALRALADRHVAASARYQTVIRAKQTAIERLESDIEAQQAAAGGMESQSQVLAQQLRDARNEADAAAAVAAEEHDALQRELQEVQDAMRVADLAAQDRSRDECDRATAAQQQLEDSLSTAQLELKEAVAQVERLQASLHEADIEKARESDAHAEQVAARDEALRAAEEIQGELRVQMSHISAEAEKGRNQGASDLAALKQEMEAASADSMALLRAQLHTEFETALANANGEASKAVAAAEAHADREIAQVRMQAEETVAAMRQQAAEKNIQLQEELAAKLATSTAQTAAQQEKNITAAQAEVARLEKEIAAQAATFNHRERATRDEHEAEISEQRQRHAEVAAAWELERSKLHSERGIQTARASQLELQVESLRGELQHVQQQLRSAGEVAEVNAARLRKEADDLRQELRKAGEAKELRDQLNDGETKRRRVLQEARLLQHQVSRGTSCRDCDVDTVFTRREL